MHDLECMKVSKDLGLDRVLSCSIACGKKQKVSCVVTVILITWLRVERMVHWSVNKMTHCQKTPQIQMENHLPMSPPPPPISRSLCVQAHSYIDSPPVQNVHSSFPSLSISPSEPEHGTSQALCTPRNLVDPHLGYPQTSKLSSHEAEANNHIPSFLPIRLSVLSKKKSSNHRPSLLDFEEHAIDFLLQSRATKIALRPRPRVLIIPEATAEIETEQPAIEKDVTEFVPPLPLINTPQIFQRTARSA